MATLTLDKILFDMQEPDRTNTLVEWAASDEPVLLKPSKGSFVEKVDGQQVNVPPKGKWFGRRTAIRMMQLFGEKGKYIGVHRATGMTEQILESRPPEEQEFWTEKKGVKFRDQYLIHDPKDPNVIEEVPDPTGAKA